MYEADPVLKRAPQRKEHFRAMFETVQTIAEARQQGQKWIGKASTEELFPTVLPTMKTWWSAILNDVHQRTTNSPSEGINTTIKLVKRRASGGRNFANFRLRIFTAF